MQLFVFVFPTAALCLFQTMELFNKSLLRHICMLFPRFSPFSSRRQGEWEWRRNFLWHWKDIKLSYMNWLNQFSYTIQPTHANPAMDLSITYFAQLHIEHSHYFTYVNFILKLPFCARVSFSLLLILLARRIRQKETWYGPSWRYCLLFHNWRSKYRVSNKLETVKLRKRKAIFFCVSEAQVFH